MAVVEAAGAELAVAGVLLLLQTLEALVVMGTALGGAFFIPAWVAPLVVGSLWIDRLRVLRGVVAGHWPNWTWMVGLDCAMLLVLVWCEPMPEPGEAESLEFEFERPTAVARLPGAAFLAGLLAVAALGLPLVSGVLRPTIPHYLGNSPNVGFALRWLRLGMRWSRLVGSIGWLGRPAFAWLPGFIR